MSAVRGIVWGFAILICAAFGGAIAYSEHAYAAQTVPATFNFQGKLADATGQPMPDGLYNIRFRAYLSAPTGGTPIWTETHDAGNRVQVKNGIFSTKLGAITPFSASDFAAYTIYIEIELPTPASATCDGTGCSPSWTEGAMTPRQPVASQGYAMNADLIDGIDGANLAQYGSSNTFTGSNIFRPSSDSTTAFQIQKSDSTPLLVADTQNMALKIGGGDVSPDATPALLVFDYKNTSGDPTGTNGAMYYNSFTNVFRCYENGAWKSCFTDPYIRDGFNYKQDFYGNVNATAGFFPATFVANLDSTLTVFGNNKGASAISQTSEPTHPGIWRLGTGTTANGNAYTTTTLSPSSGLSWPYRLGEGTWTFDAGVRMPTLATSVQNYTVRVGLLQAIGGVVRGCILRYDFATSANWIGVCGNGTTESTCDTGLAVVGNTWYKTKFVVNSAGTSVAFNVDDGTNSNSCNVTSLIPTADNLAIVIGIAKTVGTTSRFMDLDYLDITYDTSSR